VVEPSAPASTATPAAPAGPVTWKRGTKGEDFKSNAGVTGTIQHAGTTSILVGWYGSGEGPLVTAAAWSSRDATVWDRVKWKAPYGSVAYAVTTWSDELVAVGEDPDGNGRVWTSSDGGAWVASEVPGAQFRDGLASATGLIALGYARDPQTRPIMWTSVDATTWLPTPIAALGDPRSLAASPEGVIVAAGLVRGAGRDDLPTVWRSVGGATWEAVALEGLSAGRWFIRALEYTPVGFVLSVSQFADTGAVNSVWVSTDGATWQRTLEVTGGDSFSAVGTRGAAAMLIGGGGTWLSTDGNTWTKTLVATFDGYEVQGGVITLADGRLLAAGQRFDGGGTAIATWIGDPAP
jgi:hypothetical protein